MGKGLTCGVVVLSLALATGSAASQEKPRALSVDEAIQLALDNSKSLHASEMKAQYADARASEINASRLPSLKFSGSYTRLSDIDPFQITMPIPGLAQNTFVLSPSIPNNYTFRVTLAQPLFTGFKLENSSRAADLSAEAAQADFVKDRSETIYAARSAYWTLFKAREVKKVVDENVQSIEAHLKDAQNLLDQGLLTTNDVLKIQVQLSSTRLLQIDAKNAVLISTINLNSLLGLPLSAGIDPVSTIAPGAQDSLAVTSLVQKALDQRSDVKAMDLRVQSGEAGVSAARGGWWPQIALVGNYTSARPNPRVVPSRDLFKDTWDIGVQVSLDIWNWGTTAHQTAQAQAQLAQARDAGGSLRDGVVLEVTQNYLNLLQAQEKISVAAQTVEQAQENARITGEKFQEGLALTTDVLDAETSLLQARTNHTQSLVDYELATARLMKSIGEDQR